jgi:nucleotide-binding universal stress UspA family protein
MTGERVIVVGVDGSDGGRRALQWAVREAGTRGGTVQAVAAWRWDLPGGGLGIPGEEEPARDGQHHAEDVLADEIAAMSSGVMVASQAIEGRPAEVLGAAARNADLLVLGSHGHSRFWHTVLGSVAEECIRRATCPVVVIPVPHEEGRPPAAPATREGVPSSGPRAGQREEEPR